MSKIDELVKLCKDSVHITPMTPVGFILSVHHDLDKALTLRQLRSTN